MKTYNIPIAWQSYQRFPVEAENLQEATEKALKLFLSIPDDQYLEDSFELDHDMIEEEHPDETYDFKKTIQSL